MKPPAPGPVSGDSAANDISEAATAASTALPPARRARAPASAVSGCPPATTPLMGAMLEPQAARRGPFPGYFVAPGCQLGRQGVASLNRNCLVSSDLCRGVPG